MHPLVWEPTNRPTSAAGGQAVAVFDAMTDQRWLMVIDPSTALWKRIKALCGYNGRKPIDAKTTDRVRISDYWDGGSRNYTSFVNMFTWQHVITPHYERQAQGNPHNAAIGDCRLPSGVCGIQRYVSGRRYESVHVYVRAEDRHLLR